MKLTYNNNI